MRDMVAHRRKILLGASQEREERGRCDRGFPASVSDSPDGNLGPATAFPSGFSRHNQGRPCSDDLEYNRDAKQRPRAKQGMACLTSEQFRSLSGLPLSLLETSTCQSCQVNYWVQLNRVRKRLFGHSGYRKTSLVLRSGCCKKSRVLLGVCI